VGCPGLVLIHNPFVQPSRGRLVRGGVVVCLSLAFFSAVFQIRQEPFWSAGMGDWMDPYFVNALLEHWTQSIVHLRNPISPPMFFPQEMTLGYSHGLVLYAPIYAPLRAFFHPFQAYNLTLFVVMVLGTISLYALLRIHFRLTFVESVLFTAFFATSANIINGGIEAWSQRASIFLVPPALLMLVHSHRMRDGWPKLAMAFMAGLVTMLSFVQDFYTAQFTAFFAVLMIVAYLAIEGGWPRMDAAGTGWAARGARVQRIVIVVAGLTMGWAVFIVLAGGVETTIMGVRIRSHDWRRPLGVGLAVVLTYFIVRAGLRVKPSWPRRSRWLDAVLLGGAVGAAVFAWIYLPVYWQYGAFPEEQLENALRHLNPSRWHGWRDVVRDIQVTDSIRPYMFVLIVAVLACVPWLNSDRSARRYALGLLAISVVVLLVPISYGGFSLWREAFAPLPGFRAIRDPVRIIYSYELAIVLVLALIVSRPLVKPIFRVVIVLALAVVMLGSKPPGTFGYKRPIQIYRRWVSAPVEIDRSCESFYIKRASAQYEARSVDKWTLYNLDAVFIALRYSLPTLNGYSAWVPVGWNITNPNDHEYTDNVNSWIAQKRLTNVCELDIDARTIKPYQPRSSVSFP
jgi:hypothetical protein